MERQDNEIFLEQLKSRLPIEQVVGEYVRLKRAGSRLVGLCPFHTEKTGSFTVFSDSQSYYCFGCHAGGDVITFIRTIENLDYPDALRFLADRAGLQMPERRGDSAEYRQRRELVLKINTAAARHFHDNLLGEKGAPGREYLEKRRLTEGIITRFGLGYAPDSWNDCLDYLAAQGFTKEQAALAGLASRGERSGYYDRFRGRVIFPIIDPAGRVIAFGGRIIGPGEPKYVNSSDSPVFKKGSQLFALNFAKNSKTDRLILCEGYMDVISLHQAGFTGAVATLGTAITEEQARLMSRYAGSVVIAYDSDAAGQKAADKAIGLLSATGIDVRVLDMGDVKDPDEYIVKHGAARFTRLLDASGSHTTFRLHKAAAELDLNIPEDKAEYLKRAVVILSDIASPVETEVYVGRVAQQTGVSADVIRAEIRAVAQRAAEKAKKTGEREALRRASGTARGEVNREKRDNLRAAVAEEALLALLCRHPDYLQKLKPGITPDDFVTDYNRNLFRAVLDVISRTGGADLASVGEALTVEEMSRLTQYTVKTIVGADPFRQAQDCVQVIHDCTGARAIADSDPETIKKYIEGKNSSEL